MDMRADGGGGGGGKFSLGGGSWVGRPNAKAKNYTNARTREKGGRTVNDTVEVLHCGRFDVRFFLMEKSRVAWCGLLIQEVRALSTLIIQRRGFVFFR
jgi:hypothetical protein